MKKLIQAALFMLALCLPAIGFCASSIMKVEGCEEWVSLRKEPSAYATRMKRIPLGALVTDCRYANSDYTYCVYDNMGGYVMTKYLAETSETPVPAPVTTPNPNASALYGLTIDKLSTRSGPCTTYEDMGTYSVKGKWNHFAMGVDNVDEAYQIALDAGFKPLTPPKFAPLESTPKKITLNVAFVTGPDGEEVEFFKEV